MSAAGSGPPSPGPPPLRPFGLVLHRDGRWSHEGEPVLNRRLREHFDRSVDYLPDEGKYIVRLGHFRGEIELEEAGFFVRGVDADSGRITLSDRSSERLDPTTLRPSCDSESLLCSVKRDLVDGGLPARFTHAAQAELWHSVEVVDGVPVLRLADVRHPISHLLAGTG